MNNIPHSNLNSNIFRSPINNMEHRNQSPNSVHNQNQAPKIHENQSSQTPSWSTASNARVDSSASDLEELTKWTFDMANQQSANKDSKVMELLLLLEMKIIQVKISRNRFKISKRTF